MLLGNLAAIDVFATLGDVDATEYQKTYQDNLDVQRLVGEDIFNGAKPLKLDRLFDSEAMASADDMEEDKQPELIKKQNRILLDEASFQMSPDIFNNNTRLGGCLYEGFSKIFEDQNERD